MISVNMYDLRRVKERNFALELGYRLHESLRLEQDTRMIERKMNHLHRGLVSPDDTVNQSTIDSLMKRLGISEAIDRKFPPKSQVVISDALEREEKRRRLIQKEIDHLTSLRRERMKLFNRVNTHAVIRDQRMERAKITRVMGERTCCIISSLPDPAIEDPDGAGEGRRDILEVKAGLRERDQKECQQTEDLVQAYDNLYEGRRQMVRDRLQQEAGEMRQRWADNRHMLSQIRKEMREKERTSLTKS